MLILLKIRCNIVNADHLMDCGYHLTSLLLFYDSWVVGDWWGGGVGVTLGRSYYYTLKNNRLSEGLFTDFVSHMYLISF